MLSDKDTSYATFMWWLTIFSTILRIIRLIFKVLWIPFKIALIFYLIHLLGYDTEPLYAQLNNLSLGTIDWYYQSIIDFLKSLRENYKTEQ